jgi:hypothetical protein
VQLWQVLARRVHAALGVEDAVVEEVVVVDVEVAR